MTFAAFVLALLALVASVGALLMLARAGLWFAPIPTHRPPVRVPTLAVTINVNSRGRCNNEFRGTVVVTVTYPAPLPRNRAEVRLTLADKNRNNISFVRLSKTDLGIVRNNTRKRVSFDGEITDVCQDGTFDVEVTGQLQGTGTGPDSASDTGTVPANPIKAQAPTGITPSGDGSFSYGARNPTDSNTEVILTCCGGAGAAGVYTIDFVRPSNVKNLRANPANINCPGGPHYIAISGKLIDLTQRGLVTVRVTAPGGKYCTVATIIEPAA